MRLLLPSDRQTDRQGKMAGGRGARSPGLRLCWRLTATERLCTLSRARPRAVLPGLGAMAVLFSSPSQRAHYPQTNAGCPTGRQAQHRPSVCPSVRLLQDRQSPSPAPQSSQGAGAAAFTPALSGGAWLPVTVRTVSCGRCGCCRSHT